MKKIIAVLVFAVVLTLLIGCGEEEVAQLSELQQKGNVYVVPKTQKPYSGKFVTTYKNNVIKEAGSLKNGKRDGEITIYREDGSIDEVETFMDGVLNGKWEKYDKNGKLRYVEHYKDGKLEGKREFYNEKGKFMLKSFTDQRDGRTYTTVKIGSQTWIAENLNYNVNGSKCYKNDDNNCQIYGRLYDWKTAMKACPSGWHLPSDDEWQKLVDFVGGDETAGAILKAASGWKDNGNSSDGLGFSALPGGYGGSGGNFNYVGLLGNWWSATENYASNVYCRTMYYSGSNVGRDDYGKFGLFSVRCVQD